MLDRRNDSPHQEISRIESSLSRFLIFSMCTLALYATLNAILGVYILVVIQAVVFITLPILYWWLKHGGSQLFIKHAIGLATLIVFVPLIFVPSIDHTGIYWMFVFPLVAFFFLGVQTGMLWTVLYTMTLLCGLALAYLGNLPLHYTWTQISLSLLELLLCSLIAYFFVSDNEKAEREQQAHLHYLKSVDRIELALHSQAEIDKGMHTAIQTLLDIFQASRVCLVSSSNTDAADQCISFECMSDSLSTDKKAHHMSQESIQLLVQAQTNDQPACYDDMHPFPGDPINSEILCSQSKMIMVLHPNQEQAWLLVLHQCDYSRHWNNDEQRLFQDISRRIEGALQQVLLYQKLKTSTEDLLQAKQEAEAASDAKSEFLSVMSHELRTPLHGIIGLQDLIAADSSTLTSEQFEHLTLAQQAARSLSDLVNDILNLSKVESGSIQLNHQEFSLKNLMLDAISPFVISCRNKHLPLKVELADVPEFIIGDEIRLRQILINLIGNAVKFTEKGYIHIHITQSGKYLSFHIKDTGIGISEDMLEHIFEPFQQESPLMQREHTGTGLGTTIAKRFVELMDGQIHVDSELGVGSCFTFRIPFEAGKGSNITWQTDGSHMIHAMPATQSKAPSKRGKQNIHILLAEDDPIGQRIAAKRLRRMGILVDIAEDGFTAWVKSQTGIHDLLLTDIRMPKMDGIELTKRIRQHESEHKKPRLPIVGLSAHALTEIEHECCEAGMDAFMIKPIDPDSVLRKVQEIIEQHKKPPHNYVI